jgi:hypothetical protein
MPAYRAEIGNNTTNLDMCNYFGSRLTMGQLRQVYFWARDEIGFRPQLAAKEKAAAEQPPMGMPLDHQA